MKASRIFRHSLGKSMSYRGYLMLEIAAFFLYFLKLSAFLVIHSVLVYSSSFHHNYRMPASQWKVTLSSYFPMSDSGSLPRHLILAFSFHG